MINYEIIEKISTIILIISLTIAFTALATNQIAGYLWKARLAYTPEQIVCDKNPYFECPRPTFFNISMPITGNSIR